MTERWSIAVFAHNEARNIAATIRSIDIAAAGASVDVVVLANGCQDRTVAVVRELALASIQLQVIEIPLGDKANAWNLYVHEFAATHPVKAVAMHVFVDGDVRVEADALRALATAFDQVPKANAVGALPTTGRDREAWRRRMIANGTLAGGLYALRGDFVERIRLRKIHMPRGLIGEDWLVSLLAKSDLQPLSAIAISGERVVFANQAGFAFRSLSLLRPGDYRIYLRRLWRYSLRGVQFEMVFGWLLHRPPESMPTDIEALYSLSTPPSRLKWIGFTSVLRFLAVQHVRNVRTNGSKKSGV